MALRLRTSAPEWGTAKCKDYYFNHDDDPFFADNEEETSEAIKFCNGTEDTILCPIRDSCLLFALVNNEKYGVWGGTTALTRKAIRYKWRPSRKEKIREEWKWMTEEEALRGLRRSTIQQLSEE